MKQIAIVGAGMGPDTMTKEGLRAVEDAEALFGAPRLIAAVAPVGKPAVEAYRPERVRALVEARAETRFAVLVSGDTGFYSAAQGLREALSGHAVTCVPGVSSLAYLFARLGRPWQNAALCSLHGRAANLVDTVRRNALTFALTGGNLAQCAQSLADAGFGALAATVGENLGGAQERIFTATAGELAARSFPMLSALLVENPHPDARTRAGIPDGAFVRGDVPMTKADVRAVLQSKLAVMPDSVCCDVGAGTGSVTVELALSAYAGAVYAVDPNPAAIALVEQNCRRFHIGNVVPIIGRAPEALAALPPFDAAFIGGSGGSMAEIFAAVLERNPHARIVASAVTLESVGTALTAFAARGIEPEIVQLSVSCARPASGLHMLVGNNPVTLISGGGPCINES